MECSKCFEEMELKGGWVSQTGMNIDLYQCPSCREVAIVLREKKENPT